MAGFTSATRPSASTRKIASAAMSMMPRTRAADSTSLSSRAFSIVMSVAAETKRTGTPASSSCGVIVVSTQKVDPSLARLQICPLQVRPRSRVSRSTR